MIADRRYYFAGAMLLTDPVSLLECRNADRSSAKGPFPDESAFRSFYDRTASGLRSYLRVVSRNTGIADDLLQESYLRFLRSAIASLNDYQMKAYLYKTANSVVRDHWRAEKRFRRWQNDAMPDSESRKNPDLSTDISEVFRRLDPRRQALLWLAYVEGFQHSEIADVLGLKKKSVRVLLFRTRRQFAEMLAKEGLSPMERG